MYFEILTNNFRSTVIKYRFFYSRMMTPVIALLIWNILVTQQHEQKISASTGAYFEKIDGIHIYQHTAPIIYTLPVQTQMDTEKIRRKLHDASEGIENTLEGNNDRINIQNLLKNLDEMEKMNTAIFSEFELSDNSRKRTKRGIQFFGSALQWCCNVMTVRDGRTILKNQMSLKKAYEEARTAILDSHAELINVTNDLRHFSNAASHEMNILNNMMEQERAELNAQKKYTFTKAKYAEYYNTAVNIFSTASVINSKETYLFLSCKNNHIPSAIIEQETLYHDLIKIKRAAINNGLELAIKPEDLNLYLHTKIVTCTTYEDQVEIEIKVPLKKLGAELSLHEFVPITFKSHDGKLCSWEQEPAMVIYEENDRTVKIASGTQMDKCNTNDPICYVPQGRGASNKAACAAALFLEKPYREMLKACSLKCEDNHGNTIVKQIGEEKFAITNGKKNLIITNTANNSKWQTTLEEEWPGMSIMEVPCELKVEQILENGQIEILIPAGIPCIRKTNPQISIKHHLPVVWTNIGDVEIKGGFEQTFTFRNIGTAYDPKWAEKVPYFTTVTPIKELEKRLKDVEVNIPDMKGDDSFNLIHIILITWCAALTLIVSFIILKECLNSVRTAIAPAGEANIAGTLVDLATKVL